jgi:glycosyltransferase involved in cell wall biosynthesis
VPTGVHQLLPVFSYGDAIGAATLRTQAILRGLGFRSETFAGLVDQRLAAHARGAGELLDALQPGDAVIYRLSIGSPLAQQVERCGARLVIVYHNITPPEFYRGTSLEVTLRLEQGRRDLRRLAPLADLVIADSSFNLAEARAAGARRFAVVPPPIDLTRLAPRPSHPSDPPSVLFVGRVAPNKRHDTLLRAVAALRATAVPDARLVIAGSADDTGSYLERLRDLAERLGISDAVELDGRRLSDTEISRRYARAAVFACASDHEGFGIPLVEAMAFEVPVAAYAAGAVPETVGGAGLLLHDRDPLVWAACIARLIRDQELRRGLVAAGRQRVAELSEPVIAEKLATALGDAGIEP